MKLRNAITWGFLLVCTLGFRVIPGGNTWSISNDDKTIWVRFCNSPTIKKHDYPEGDVLFGSTPTFATLFQTILNDYNSVTGSYLRLSNYPTDPNNPPAPSTGQSAFTITKGGVRTIDVCFETQTFTGGYARLKWDENTNRVNGCEIKLNEADVTESGKRMVRTLTHEMGHCFGLNHSQENIDSVMSYYSDAIRLKSDDRMALIYLYPVDSNFGQETATYGLSCAPK